MKFDKAAEAMLNGKKIKRSCWSIWMSIDTPTSITVNMCEMLADDWELYEEPKKPRLLAHAIRKQCGMYSLSMNMYDSEDSARKVLLGTFHSWPAVPNKDGYFEVPS